MMPLSWAFRRVGDVYLGNTKSDITQIADQVARSDLRQAGQDRLRQKRWVRAKYGGPWVKVVDEIRAAGVDKRRLVNRQSRTNPPGQPHRPADRRLNFHWEAWIEGLRFPLTDLHLIRPNGLGARKSGLRSNDNGNGRWNKRAGGRDGDDERRATD